MDIIDWLSNIGQAISCAIVYPNLCRHIASLGHNEFILNPYCFVRRLVELFMFITKLFYLWDTELLLSEPAIANFMEILIRIRTLSFSKCAENEV